MADIEMVIKGLEELRENMQSKNQGSFVRICDDAIELLKFQRAIIQSLYVQIHDLEEEVRMAWE